MATTNFNLRLDKDLRDKAFSVFDSYGLTASQAFKLFLNQVAETKAIPLSFNYQAQEPNAITQAAMLELEEGRGLKSSSVEELLEELADSRVNNV